ncbi:MAG: hypothetical protein C4288_07430 [Leptolyngbya sp. ERB_1_1]
MKLRLLRTAIGVLTLLLCSGALFLYLYFRAALSQERDTSDILKAAINLEWTRTDSALIRFNSNRLLIRAGSSGLHNHLGKQGWVQVDQLGSLRIYRRGSQRLDVDCGMFSGRYLICDVDPQVRKP